MQPILGNLKNKYPTQAFHIEIPLRTSRVRLPVGNPDDFDLEPDLIEAGPDLLAIQEAVRALKEFETQ